MENLSYSHTPGNFTYHYETVPERLELQAQLLGSKEVYLFLDPDGNRISITAKDLYEKSKLLAQSFIKLGIRKGDVIALCLGNDLYGLLGLFGVILSGGIVLNTISSKEDGTDIKTVLEKTGAKALVIHSGENNVLRACMNFIDGFEADGTAKSAVLPSLRYFLTTTDVSEHATLTLDRLLSSSEMNNSLPKPDVDDILILFTTSGSTGEPKFVPQTHFIVMIIGHHLKESINYEPDDVIYTERRFAWIGGFPFMLLHDGVKVVTKTSAFPDMKRHCEFTLNALVKEQCTHACLFPATIIGINDLVLKMSTCPLNLKGIQTGALPVSLACFSAIGKYTMCITNCYGSSEAGVITSLPVFNNNQIVEYKTGKPVPGTEVKIVDRNGSVVRKGKSGGIHVRSQSLFRGYNNNKQRTDEVLSISGWFNTDDTGFLTKDGELVVTGRQSDIILQGGKNYAPSEVEGIIKAHPGVLDVVAVPVPDEALFQLVCACIIAKPGFTLTTEEMKEFYMSRYLSQAGEAFSGFIPRMFLMFDEFPRLYNGKPDKKRLTEEATKRKN